MIRKILLASTALTLSLSSLQAQEEVLESVGEILEDRAKAVMLNWLLKDITAKFCTPSSTGRDKQVFKSFCNLTSTFKGNLLAIAPMLKTALKADIKDSLEVLLGKNYLDAAEEDLKELLKMTKS